VPLLQGSTCDYKMHPLLGSWNGTQASSLGGAANNFIAYGSFVWTWIAAHWELFISWLEQPRRFSIMTFRSRLTCGLADILAIILAWWVTFTVIITVLLTFGGFGHGGIIAGKFAYAFSFLEIV
jgi:hypothetical protein